MAKHAGTREVQCYRCGHRREVGGRTQSTNCPGCNKPLQVSDIVVKGYLAVKELQTCGRIIVHKKGKVIADLVEAQLGIECEGLIEAKQVIAGGNLQLGQKSTFKGGQTHAQNLIMKAGGKMKPSALNIPSDPKGVKDLLPP